MECLVPCEQPTVLYPVLQEHTFGPVQLPRPEQLLTSSQETKSKIQIRKKYDNTLTACLKAIKESMK